MIGVLGESTHATCIASVTVNVSLCSVQFDYGLVTTEVAGGASLDLYNTLTLSPVTVSSAGEYTCTVSIIDTPSFLYKEYFTKDQCSCHTESAMQVLQ